ncbi:MAG: bifunctional FO biosynthesis protein CofGH [Actinomycetota bacterium]|nr:bifunctional FO biosynthesis protein CofGH [Actinomycetota bacterium]
MDGRWEAVLAVALAGERLQLEDALALAAAPADPVCAAAAELRERGKGRLVTYSRKVFIPLTKLCRDVCHYCTFARPPRRGERAYLLPEDVLAVARAGASAGCHEALFTLGDKPELRYRAARDELRALGCETTLEYLARTAELVLEETGLLPHLNPGVMTRGDLAALRRASASMGIMLETLSPRLSQRGGPHFGSPDKLPARRLETIRLAGELAVPFTSGILIGIGETRRERIEALLALRDAGERYGHVQEVIVQNFRAKPETRMADHPEPVLADLQWTAAVARLVLGPGWNIQAPPNLSGAEYPRLLDAGINDWGGISPVTIDHVNPEAPWPEIALLERATRERGLELAPRLAVYPEYVADLGRWADHGVARYILRRADADGLARDDGWYAGATAPAPPLDGLLADAAETGATPPPLELDREDGDASGRPPRRLDSDTTSDATEAAAGSVRPLPTGAERGSFHPPPASSVPRHPLRLRAECEQELSPGVASALAKVDEGVELGEDDATSLFRARGRDLRAVLAAADRLRREVCGDAVTYVVTRNINYTNVCYFRCGFCAFSKGKLAENLRGRPYLVPVDEIVRRGREAWERGAVELCLQGGIHPAFTGEYYVEVCNAIKAALPDIHVHAFSALEVWQGAATLGQPLGPYLARLRAAGLASLPGTAAEILDDEVRRLICPDKVATEQWLEVHDTAHREGLHSTTTMMFGHVDAPRHWARHLLRLREQQRRSGGFTEFVPLPFVHMEAPIFIRGGARPGPTFREALLVHAVGRLALHPWITNVQASWVKLGADGALAALRAGANDLGGTLMNESISRAAGASHGQEMPPEGMERAIRSIGRIPRQRTTLYGTPEAERTRASFGAPPLAEPLTPSVNDARMASPKHLVRPGLAAASR